jgi:hypothetical protein
VSAELAVRLGPAGAVHPVLPRDHLGAVRTGPSAASAHGGACSAVCVPSFAAAVVGGVGELLQPRAATVAGSRPGAQVVRDEVGGAVAQLKQRRAVASRYDELAVHYQATIEIATINTWLRDLSHRL